MKLWKASWILAAAIAAAPSTALGGDAFFKGGFVFHPDTGSFSDRWLVTIGSDWEFSPLAYVGVEFQGAYHSANPAGALASVQSVPANVLVNAKWKSDQEMIRPYAGIGGGLMSTLVRTDVFGQSDTRYDTNAGLQFMGGVEFDRRWTVELLGQRVLVDGAGFTWAVLGGVTW